MKQRKDGRWVKLKTIDGKRIPFYSKETTERKALKDIENQLLEYEHQKNSKKHSFKSIADEMLEIQSKTVSYATLQSYTHALKHLKTLYDMNIEDVTPMMVQTIINELGAKKYSKSAMSKVKTTIGLILKQAILNGCQVSLFSRSLKIPKTKTKQVLSPDEMVIETITKNATTTEFGMWAFILLYSGLRPGELNGLRKRDIDFNKKIISVNQAVEFIENQPNIKDLTKSEAGIRKVPILDLLYQHLYNQCLNLNDDHLIFGIDKPFSKTQLRKKWNKYCKEIGYKFTQYQLRHAYAFILYRANIDPKTAQYLLGHADFSTTMNIYTQFSKEKNMEAADILNSFVQDKLFQNV